MKAGEVRDFKLEVEHGEHKHEQNEGRAVADTFADIGNLGGDHEKMIRQRHGGIKR